MAGLAFSYVANDTFIHKLNPTFKLLFLIFFSITISSAKGVELYVAIVSLFVIGALARVNLCHNLIKMPAMLVIAMFIALTEYINTKSISSTVDESLSFLGVLLLAILFITTTDIIELASSLGHYLHHVIGKNAWVLSSSIMITFVLLPMIFSCSTTMLQARRARGGRFFDHPVKNLSEYTISLLLLLFKKAERFEDALISRAYDAKAERDAKTAQRCDYIALIIVALALVLIIATRRFF